ACCPVTVAPEDVFSIPTRRSSDLVNQNSLSWRLPFMEYRRKFPLSTDLKTRVVLGEDQQRGVFTNGYFCGEINSRNKVTLTRRRSEEHTSELQSRANLVSRIRLQK